MHREEKDHLFYQNHPALGSIPTIHQCPQGYSTRSNVTCTHKETEVFGKRHSLHLVHNVEMCSVQGTICTSFR